jgi:hypothetical protein
MKKIISIIAILILPILTWAQQQENKASTSLSFDVTLDNNSKSEDITFTIEPGTKSFNLRILTSIRAGRVVVEVIDPSNTKQGTFSVGSESSAEKKHSSGNFFKSWKEPLAGTWTVKSSPTTAKGFVQVETTFLQ